MPKCPICKAEGGSFGEPILFEGLGGAEYLKCDLCNGKGKISLILYLKYKWDTRKEASE